MPDDPTGAVRDVDQADRARNPPRPRVWAPLGVPREVEPPGANRKQALFGAVNSRTGQTPFAPRPPQRRAACQAFVDQVVLPAYREVASLCLIVDGAGLDTSRSPRAWLAQRPQRVRVPLPSSAPKLNWQELLGRWLRADVTPNHFCRPCDALVAAARRCFAKRAREPKAGLRRIGRDYPTLLDHQLAAIA